MSPHYDHTQPGTVIRVSLGGAAVICLLLGLVPLGYAAKATFLITGVGIGFVCLLFHDLRVVVDRKNVVVRFGSGLVRFRFPIAKVVAAEIVRNTWGHGWGVHYTRDGWVYNVSGYDAVELTRSNGKKVRIGTDEPEALHHAIEESLGSGK